MWTNCDICHEDEPAGTLNIICYNTVTNTVLNILARSCPERTTLTLRTLRRARCLKCWSTKFSTHSATTTWSRSSTSWIATATLSNVPNSFGGGESCDWSDVVMFTNTWCRFGQRALLTTLKIISTVGADSCRANWNRRKRRSLFRLRDFPSTTFPWDTTIVFTTTRASNTSI